MAERKDIVAVVYRALDETNKQLPAEKKLVKTETTVVDSTALESLNLVNFLLAVEEQLQLDCGLEIDLAASLSPNAEVPFHNAGELADYILKHTSKSDSL
jgi:acyl carrier protein